MKAVRILTLSLVFVFAVAAPSNETQEVKRLTCSINKLCTDVDRTLWLGRRNQAKLFLQVLEDTHQAPINSSLFVNRFYEYMKNASDHLYPPFQDKGNDELKKQLLTNIRDDLCFDKQTAGYLLNNESETWPMACLWTGSDINGTCAPAPPTSTDFDFVKKDEWKEKVRNFRKDIGCTNPEIQMADYINELYICREQCLNAGVNYIFALFIVLSMLFVMGALCF